MSANYAWTQRNFNNIPFPTRGYGLAVEVGPGLTLGSQRSPFLRSRARVLGFIPFNESAYPSAAQAPRLAWRAEGGAVGARSSVVLPSTQLFLTGGDTTVRGYGYREIGVVQADGSLEPGRYLAVGSLEWQKPIVRNGRASEFESTVFIDAGAVADQASKLRAKVGVGVGARWRSSVGPLEVDLAWGAATRRLRLHLAVGFTFSTLARNQLQALQATFLFFLPSMLLSGFMFPFRGMPVWAQRVGEVLPLTHFLRIVRGILLKGNGLAQLWPEVWPLLAFLGVAGALALLRYRQTLD